MELSRKTIFLDLSFTMNSGLFDSDLVHYYPVFDFHVVFLGPFPFYFTLLICLGIDFLGSTLECCILSGTLYDYIASPKLLLNINLFGMKLPLNCSYSTLKNGVM